MHFVSQDTLAAQARMLSDSVYTALQARKSRLRSFRVWGEGGRLWVEPVRCGTSSARPSWRTAACGTELVAGFVVPLAGSSIGILCTLHGKRHWSHIQNLLLNPDVCADG